MLINLKSALQMYHGSLYNTNRNGVCDLRTQDPNFNKGHGKRFLDAFDRALARGDFKP